MLHACYKYLLFTGIETSSCEIHSLMKGPAPCKNYNSGAEGGYDHDSHLLDTELVTLILNLVIV